MQMSLAATQLDCRVILDAPQILIALLESQTWCPADWFQKRQASLGVTLVQRVESALNLNGLSFASLIIHVGK
jgi:hypothetical protein